LINIDPARVIKFEVEVPAGQFEQLLSEHNKVRLGIFDSKALRNSKTADDGLRTLASPGKGIPTIRANYKDAGVYHGMSEAESFASVYDAHIHHGKKPLEEFLTDEIYLTGDIIVDAWYNASDSLHYKRAGNAIAGVAKRAYVKMSHELRYLTSEWRRGEKGFSSYAIGTGQTLQAIKGKIEKKL
jgi:hypothetical protein